MKRNIIVTLMAIPMSMMLISGAMALGPQPEPPDKQATTLSPRSGDSKTFTMGTPMPIPPSRFGKVKIK